MRDLPIRYGDLLLADCSTVGAFIGDIEVMLSATAATIPIVEDADSLPIDPKALAWSLRRLCAERNVIVVAATAAKR